MRNRTTINKIKTFTLTSVFKCWRVVLKKIVFQCGWIETLVVKYCKAVNREWQYWGTSWPDSWLATEILGKLMGNFGKQSKLCTFPELLTLWGLRDRSVKRYRFFDEKEHHALFLVSLKILFLFLLLIIYSSFLSYYINVHWFVL